MNPLFHTEFSISDSLKNVRKSVLIYETIILRTVWIFNNFDIIALGIIITRGTELKTFPKHYGLNKYGASTTWMGKLKYRLDSRRSGGCPMLAIGITPECIRGYQPD